MCANNVWQSFRSTNGIWPVRNLKSIFEYSRSSGICKKKLLKNQNYKLYKNRLFKCKNTRLEKDFHEFWYWRILLKLID